MLRASDQDTIFAPASGSGRAAVSIVRLSGPGSANILVALTRGALPEPRRLVLRALRDPSGEMIDRAMVVWLPGPATFTGEDQGEIQCHGSPAVRSALLGTLAAFDNCRAAHPGEFTRRAFLNGRMDLTDVEGLADLIDADTEAQRRQALRQLEGALGRKVRDWRQSLVEAMAKLEAALDFSDEGDVAAATLEQEAGLIAREVAHSIGQELRGARHGERIREGFVVVLVGPANAGKSSLLNAVARRDVAIVSPRAGTTRDAIEVRCDLGGLPVTFVDTAGLRATPDPVESEGVARTLAHARDADLVLWLDAPDLPREEPPPDLAGPVVRVATKADLGDVAQSLAVSARTGAGLPEVLSLVADQLNEANPGEGAAFTRARHRQALEKCSEALSRVEPALAGARAELAAEDVRMALRALGQITGVVDVEEVLDAIFGSLCIGK